MRPASVRITGWGMYAPERVLTNADLAKIRELNLDRLRSRTLSTLFPRAEGAAGLRQRLDQLRNEASAALADGVTLIRMRNNWVGDPSNPQVEIDDLAAELSPICG